MRQPPFTVFLDRDGVLNENPHRGIRRPRNYRLYPYAAGCVKDLNDAGLRTCLVTNQPWVGSLNATPGMIRRVHEEMQRQLAAGGARLDRLEVSYAPPFPVLAVGAFRRRKPQAGMVEAAAAAWRADGSGFDPRRAVMVGDTWRDAGLARSAGLPCILLATTHAPDELRRRLLAKGVPVPDIVPDLRAAVPRILELAA